MMLMAVLQLQKQPIAVRGCTDWRKEGGERARSQKKWTNKINIESNNGLPIYGVCHIHCHNKILSQVVRDKKVC